MSHVWKIVAGLILVLAGIGSFNMALWVTDRAPPIRFESARAIAMFVRQGWSIEVEFEVFRERVCPIDAKRWLYDSQWRRHSIPSFTTGMELLAGRETYRRSITIPDAATTGPLYYQVVLDYICNPLQRILSWPVRVYSPPIKFEIKGKDP